MKKLNKIENACAAVALRYAAKEPEDRVIEICLGQGLFDEQWKAAANKLGIRLREAGGCPVMLKTFIKNNPYGMWIATTKNHMFIVDNGKIIDPEWENKGLSRMILGTYYILGS